MSRPLPRYLEQAIEHDPLEAMLAQRQAEHEQARAAANEGRPLDADPQDLRGIPCLAKGVAGTSPGTNPTTAIHRLERRLPTSAPRATLPNVG